MTLVTLGEAMKILCPPLITLICVRFESPLVARIILPCHRVIGKNGKLTGYGGGIERKRWLINHEKEIIVLTL